MRRFISLLICAALLAVLTPLMSSAALSGQIRSDQLIRIGLRYGDAALRSANLQNVTGCGSGYQIGYYSDGSFVPVHTLSDVEITIRQGGGGYIITNTVTGNTLYEFTGSQRLAVRPVQNGSEKCVTWFKGYKYYGDFEYFKNSDGTLNVINVVLIEDYIKGILPYEMSPRWPVEALKAQALCARTYAVYSMGKHSSLGFDLCNTTDCQVYLGVTSANETTDRAVDETAGMYITYNGVPINAVYHSSDGGATENCENVWNDALPYLRAVKDGFEQLTNTSNTDWNFEISLSTITNILKERGNDIQGITHAYAEYTDSGNIKKLVFVDSSGEVLEYEKERARTVLRSTSYGIGVLSQRFIFEDKASPRVTSPSELTSPSSRLAEIGAAKDLSATPVPADLDYGFVVTSYGIIPYRMGFDGNGSVSVLSSSGISQQSGVFTVGGKGLSEPEISSGISASSLAIPASSSGTFIIRGSGSGHNLGMSQYGAKGMAEAGYTASDIIYYYYTDVDIITVDSVYTYNAE